MRLFLLVGLVGFLASCSNSGGGGGQSAEDQVFGEWYYESPGATSTSARGILAKLEANGNVSLASVYAYSDGTNAVAYARKSIGTWTRSGETFTLNYSYETCDPVKTETLNIRVSDGKLVVSSSTVTLSMAKVTEKSTIKTLAVIEDKNCNILSKIEKADKRIPASSKSKSFFDRMI